MFYSALYGCDLTWCKHKHWYNIAFYKYIYSYFPKLCGCSQMLNSP